MNKVLVVAVSLLFSLVLSESSNLLAQVDVGEILARARGAHGGDWNSPSMSDWVAEGEVTFHSNGEVSPSFPMEAIQKGNGQYLRRIFQEAGELRQGSDGTSQWDNLDDVFFSPASGPVKSLIEANTKRSLKRLFAQSSRPVLQYKGKRLGEYLLEAMSEEGLRTTYLIDESDWLVKGMEIEVGQGRDPFSGLAAPNIESFRFSDFRRVRGVLVAFRIERFFNGVKFEETNLTSMEFGVGLEDDLFTP